MPTVIIKSADQSRTTTTAIADDSELVTALTAGLLYEVEFTVKWGNGATVTIPQFKWAWSFTGTLIWANGYTWMQGRPCSLSMLDAQNIGTHVGIQAGVLTSATTNTTTTSIAGTGLLSCHIYMKVGDTGGNLSLQWAQGVSSANATTVYKGSSLYVAERQYPS